MSLPMDHREHDDPEVIDVWSFRAAERLKVHEQRTAADLESQVIRGSTRPAFRNLFVTRGQSREARTRRVRAA